MVLLNKLYNMDGGLHTLHWGENMIKERSFSTMYAIRLLLEPDSRNS